MKIISTFALTLALGLAYQPAFAAPKPQEAAESAKHDEHEHEGHDHGAESKEKPVMQAKETDEHGHDHGAHEKKDRKVKPVVANKTVEKHGDEDGHDHGGKEHKEGPEHKEEGHEHGHEEGEHEEAGASVGPGMAVEAYEEGRRLKLSEKAIARLGIKTAKPQAASGGLLVPDVALVIVEGETFLFVSKAGWYEKRKVMVAAKENKQALITRGIVANEQVVTYGSGSLRVTELDLSAGDEVGHDH